MERGSPEATPRWASRHQQKSMILFQIPPPFFLSVTNQRLKPFCTKRGEGGKCSSRTERKGGMKFTFTVSASVWHSSCTERDEPGMHIHTQLWKRVGYEGGTEEEERCESLCGFSTFQSDHLSLCFLPPSVPASAFNTAANRKRPKCSPSLKRVH